MRFSIPRYIAFGLLLAVFAGMAFAQTSSGTIAGVVSDQTDAVVVDAMVAAKSVETSATVTVVTNARGAFRLEGLLPGTYEVTVTAKGFVTTRIQNVDVRASIVTSLNPGMKLGASDTISVEAQSVPLATESGEVSASIGTKEIQNLPVNSLNPYSLALTLPGVTSVEGAKMTQGSEFSVNGSRPRANNFLIEGQDNNDAGIHGQSLMPSNLEAVNEVAVLTNSYSAEFGHGGGAVSNLVFRTGANDFHGSAWDRLLNSSLDASDHQDNLYGSSKSKYRENIFGFTVGGPIKKDKLFFFASYQWDRYRETANVGSLFLPTEAGYAMLQSLGNARVDTYLQAIGNLRGIKNPERIQISDDALGNPRYVEFGRTQRTGLGNLSNGTEFDATGDWIVSAKDTVHVRYIRTASNTPYDVQNFPDALPGFDSQNFGTNHNAGISETHTFGPSIVNEFRMSYGRISAAFDLTGDAKANPLALGPSVSIDGITGYGVDSGLPQGRVQNTYQYQDSVTITKGNHFFKIGGDISDIRVRDLMPFDPRGTIGYSATLADGDTGTPSYTGLANFIDDYSGPNNSVTHTFGNQVSHAGLGTQNYFVQDTWKIRPNLNLNLGFRYEYWGAPANQLAYPATDINNLGCFLCRVEEKADKGDWAPRVGFAYTPKFWNNLFGDGKTVINGGFGIFYDGMFTNIINNSASNSPNAAASADYSTQNPYLRGTANWSQVFANLPTEPTPGSTVNSIIPNLRSPRTMQWNLKVERELPANLLMTVGYIGSRGDRLYGNNQYNPYDVQTGERINTDRGSIVLRDNSGESSYHGLNTEVERRFTGGLLARVTYTWSKMMDDVSEVFTDGNWSSYPLVQYPSDRRTTDWARSAFDHKHRLSFSYIYELPKWNTDRAAYLPLKGIVNGWQISGTTSFQSGTPVNVFTGYDTNGDGISNDRPSLGNPAAPLASYAWDSSWLGLPSGSLCDGWYFWNTYDSCHPVTADSVHWIVPAQGKNGNLPRNYLTSPGIQNWDFSIQRTFSITEKQKLDFRAEMFNAFNHANPDLYYLKLSLVDDVPEPGRGITPDFANYNLTNSGHRAIKFYLKYSF